mmetsp:Transcript_2577/g.9858  ORF Transcript_2577/g.9858 Transcript_2577/m.9858 type:complete len:104 (+) Transcript_2577:1427-1738(+)
MPCSCNGCGQDFLHIHTLSALYASGLSTLLSFALSHLFMLMRDNLPNCNSDMYVQHEFFFSKNQKTIVFNVGDGGCTIGISLLTLGNGRFNLLNLFLLARRFH